MNTDTGQIYDPEEFLRLKELMGTPTEDVTFTQAFLQGKIVEVSGEVAQKVRLGERELERRAKRRKAAKAARKRNR